MAYSLWRSLSSHFSFWSGFADAGCIQRNTDWSACRWRLCRRGFGADQTRAGTGGSLAILYAAFYVMLMRF
tara:strand:+ start:175 stop:387 length:213 start_codon:yes stop_codon:yes gene_type:complete